MKIIWSPLAITRLEEISDYIALDNLSAANKFIDDVFENINQAMEMKSKITGLLAFKEELFMYLAKEFCVFFISSSIKVFPVKLIPLTVLRGVKPNRKN